MTSRGATYPWWRSEHCIFNFQLMVSPYLWHPAAEVSARVRKAAARCVCLMLAPSVSSRRCSDMAAVGGTPDDRWTWPIPPAPDPLQPSAVERLCYAPTSALQHENTIWRNSTMRVCHRKVKFDPTKALTTRRALLLAFLVLYTSGLLP
jgi:hypothetical protein